MLDINSIYTPSTEVLREGKEDSWRYISCVDLIYEESVCIDKIVV